MGAVRAAWSSASFLHYLGAFVVLGATVSLLQTLQGDYGDFAFVGWCALILFVLVAIAGGYERAEMRVAAGLFGFVALIAFIVFVGSLLEWIGLLDSTDTPISGFHIGYLLLYLVAFIAGLGYLARYSFPLGVTVVVLFAWLFVVDLISNGGNWSAIVSIFVGLVFLMVGAGVDRAYGFWLHIGAGLAIGGAFLYFWHSSWWEWVLIGIISLLYFSIAAGLDRSSYTVFGAFGLFLVAQHFIEDWVGGFSDPFGFLGVDGTSDHPWARALLYAAFGFILVGIGLWFEQRRRTPASAEPAPQ